MKLWIVSDLHLEGSFWIPETAPAHDVLVIAGDIADHQIDVVRHLHNMSRWSETPIVYVPGNHDVFGGPLSSWDRHNERLEADGVHVLASGQVIVIDGVRFLGATMWTDWLLTDSEWASQAWAARHMPEFAYVEQEGGDLIWPIHTSDAHDVHRRAIESTLREPHFGPSIVVTHHAPSPRSVRGRPQPEDAAYASNLEDLIWTWQPELWVHGHIHSASDYRIGSTRVVCNPRGYRSKDWSEDTGWDEAMVIEI